MFTLESRVGQAMLCAVNCTVNSPFTFVPRNQ